MRWRENTQKKVHILDGWTEMDIYDVDQIYVQDKER